MTTRRTPDLTPAIETPTPPVVVANEGEAKSIEPEPGDDKIVQPEPHDDPPVMFPETDVRTDEERLHDLLDGFEDGLQAIELGLGADLSSVFSRMKAIYDMYAPAPMSSPQAPEPEEERQPVEQITYHARELENALDALAKLHGSPKIARSAWEHFKSRMGAALRALRLA